MDAYMDSYLSRPSITRRSRPGVGHPDGYKVPRQRLINNSKLKKADQLSLPQMQKFEKLKRGTTPFDKTDPQMRKFFSWDLKTNPELESHTMTYSEKERKEFDLQWIKWMNDNNCWVSYFVWFHDLAHETIPAELQPVKFPEHIQKMYYGTSSIKEEPKDTAEEIIVEYPEEEIPQINVVLEDVEERQESHDWTLENGSTVKTVGDIPPWNSIVQKIGKGDYFLYPI